MGCRSNNIIFTRIACVINDRRSRHSKSTEVSFTIHRSDISLTCHKDSATKQRYIDWRNIHHTRTCLQSSAAINGISIFRMNHTPSVAQRSPMYTEHEFQRVPVASKNKTTSHCVPPVSARILPKSPLPSRAAIHIRFRNIRSIYSVTRTTRSREKT